MFLNRFQLTAAGTYVWNMLDTRKLRGGPDLRYDPYFKGDVSFNTDKAKPLSLTIKYTGQAANNDIDKVNTITPSLSYRIGNHVYLTGEFSYTNTVDNTQYVGTFGDMLSAHNAKRYIMAKMDQETYSITMKLQVNLTPDISIQLYGSPFTSTARYSNFKQALNAGANGLADRYHLLSPSELSLQNGNYVHADGEYSFSNPDFVFNEFRANLVARWEYRPGSTIYLVWERRMSEREGGKSLTPWGDNLDRLFGLPSINTLMVKLNYWFDL
jgi:hypothetical protein